MTTIDLPMSGLSVEEKRALLARMLKEQATAPRVHELSFAQQRLWFLDQLQPGDPSYNIWPVFELHGRLDVALLARSLAELVDQHAALRTRFVEHQGRQGQIFASRIELETPVVDLAGLPDDRRRQEALRLAIREGQSPFDLLRGPLFRARLFRLEPSRWWLSLVAHHIVADGWSIGVLLRDLVAVYTALHAGRPSPLAPLGLDYGDYVAWQNGRLRGEYLEKLLRFWRTQLQGVGDSVLEMPADRPRPKVLSPRGGMHLFMVERHLCEALEARGRAAGATLYMTLLALFQAWLHRLSGDRRPAVGTPVANRERPELEDLVGFFANTLVMRTNLGGDPRLGELLERVRKTTSGAYAHQEVPFEKLVDELAPARALDHTPLFQVGFVLQTVAEPELDLPELTLRPLRGEIELGGEVEIASKYDLTLELGESGRGLRGGLVYRRDLFDPTTVVRFAGYLRRILEGAVGEPDPRLSELPLLSAAEHHQLVVAWNDTAAGGASGSLQALIEERAAERPEEPAVIFEETVLSYSELDARACRVARELRRAGVEQGDAVGLYLGRCAEVVVGILAILKAGGAYVPLDPSYPEERSTFVVEDTALRVVLSLSALRRRWSSAGVEVVAIDDVLADPGSGTGTLEVPTDPRDPAYLIYTSGSTGRPKGVVLTHGNAVASTLARRRFYRRPVRRFLLVPSIAFDSSVVGLFWTFAEGGALVLPPDEAAADPARLGELVRRHRISHWLSVPSLWAAVLEHLPSAPEDLETVIVAGEACPPELIRKHRERLPGVALVNEYGPTEGTVWCAAAEILGEGGERTVTIGRPIANVRTHVLDPWGRPVPMRVAGELHLAGAGIARGYLRRPAATAERFLPDGLGRGFGERLYRTGDLTRLRPSGQLEFLGRIDHQVKLRGYRIELGEIEAILGRHPQVTQVAVAVAADSAGRRNLVGYVVAQHSEAPTPENLRTFLEERLPAFMVPPLYRVLEALPLLPNGKVDRARLPAPEGGRPATGGRAPRDRFEELLVAIWREVLERQEVGVDDHFFELGGHSLLGLQVLARVRERSGVDLALSALFEAPTVAGLASLVRDAAASRGELDPSQLRIERVSREGELALSFAQQRLWFLHQLDPQSTAYNIPVVVRLCGELCVGGLAASLSEIVRRHESLRTTFSEDRGEPRQVIAAAREVPLPVIDLSHCPAPGAALALARREIERPFDLIQGPLLRCLLIRTGVDEHLAVLSVHHIVSDGWSMGILVRELNALYAACVEQKPSPLPELEIQYADFAAWQRGWMQGEVLDTQVEFWRRSLLSQSGALPPVVEVPTDRPRPAVQSLRGATQFSAYPAALLTGLQELSRSHDVTLFMTLVAMFQTLLHRYTGQRDITVGTPVAGRRHRRSEELIGFFVNAVVLRVDLGGDPTVAELLGRVREQTVAAFAHQDLPFEKLVSELAVDRDRSRPPLFQNVFALQNVAIDALDAPGLRFEPLEIATRSAKFDLALALTEHGDGLSGAVEYATDLFDGPTARRWLVQFGELLRSAVARPANRLSELALLGDAERHQSLVEWNDVPARVEAFPPLHRRFEEWVRRAPDAVAVVFEGSMLTYRELDLRSRRLARQLRRLGVGRGTRVGLLLERSPAQPIAILGVLMAGAAYVPLDPSYPDERLLFLLRDALSDPAGAVLVSEARQRSLLERITGALEIEIVELDDPSPGVAGERVEAPASEAIPEDVAYVIYTSGSSGRPKGVEITHGNLARLFAATQGWFDFDHRDVWTLFHSYAFDFSVWEIWGALVFGGRLVIVPHPVTRSPDAFHEMLRAQRVTVLNQTPSAFYQLIRSDVVAGKAGRRELALETVVFGGEALSLGALTEWYEHHGLERPRLINMYGITETTVHVTYQPLRREMFHQAGRSPIGVPICDLDLHVCDAAGRLVPPSIPGELQVGGAGLLRGYLHQPGLTAERVVPNPFTSRPGARLYRSGDLVRWRPDGGLDYLGRIDHQVKIRGFRIELGEIEKALGEHPEIRGAAVLARDSARGQELVAYLTTTEARSSDAAEDWRAFLKDRLPGHMIPSLFVVLEELPLTSHGKVDRRALPEPGRRSPAQLEAPATWIEEELSLIFCEILDLEAVGRGSHFFDLGGHSLLSVQVVARVRERFGVDLALSALFETPTVEQLAGLIGEAIAAQDPIEPSQLRIERISREGELALSFAQQRLWFLHQLDPDNTAYNIPVAVRLCGELSVAALAASLSEIVRRHESLRTTFAEHQGEPRQVIAAARQVPLPVVDLSRCPPGAALALARREIDRPFDLTRGPLLRCLLIRTGTDVHLAVLCVHHIVSDGWSMGVLVRELNALYAACVAREPSPLPPLEIQYADFAAWQRSWMQGEVLDAQVELWRRSLLGSGSGGPAVLEVPTDRPRPAVQSFRGATQFGAYPASLLAGLQDLSRRHDVTLFMTLVAMFQTLLHRYTGQRDITVGTPVAGRRHRRSEELIGFFVNAVVLRVDLDGDPTVAELLGRVREQTVTAFAHQDLPFEKLVSELGVERDMSRPPLFQNVFALQNAPLGALDAPGLRFEPLEIATRSSKFDLSLALTEHEGGLSGAVEYATDLFDGPTARRWLIHFGELLRSAVTRPASRVSELEMLRGAEREQILRHWNDTGKSCPQIPRVHELFMDHARRRPDAPAMVSYDGRVLTYGELDARSNQLAHHLRRLGVGPEVLVAMCTDRTPERAVGIVGTVKAGGAYVSIDPTHPRERIAFLLDDARASILLTERRFEATLPASEAEVVLLDEGWPALDGERSRPPESGLSPENLAYVVYTSGSTGKPKGVAVPHAGLMNLVRWHQGCYDLVPGDRGTQVASPSFDASVWELWPYLCGGASLHIPDQERRLSAPGMMAFWMEQRITLAYLMTPLAEGILEEEVPADLDWEVRALIIGGDRLHHRPDPRLGFRLMNHYGPAEYSVTSTVVEVPPAGTGERLPTIGRAVDNTEIYLLDRRGNVVPIGVPGELYVAGVGLARGYLRRPGLTAEKFLPHPMSEEAGARIYRTGDLVRWLPDGDLDFLGRIDHQVKIRGLRIELGEIESVLEQHPGVREGVALVREDAPGRKRLVGYWVPARNAPRADDLSAFLEERLPPYMVPAFCLEVERFPLTPNGKIDREALARRPLPDLAEGSSGPPQTPMEKRVAEIWADVLGVAEAPVEKNFFDLGGDSLLMVKLQSRLRAELDVELQIAELFQHATIRSLAGHLEARSEAGAEAAVPRVVTRGAQRLHGHGVRSQDVAIIGMAGRFPKARNVDELWRNLCGGVDGIVDFTDEELLQEGNDPELLRHPFYVRSFGYLEDADRFDAAFFGYSPREAQLMDPQQRLFLESAHAALEDAGYGDARGSSTGVFAGTSISAYLVHLFNNREHWDELSGRQVVIGNDKDQLATRVSYQLGLCGPSLTVQTACSTSLVATHLACQSLLHGECDLALAGGVSVPVPLKQGYVYEPGGVQSPDGRCRAFDAEAAGTAIGAGLGVVTLKRLAEALADGDAIYAVIRGTAINNDGSFKVGFTAPSVEGQSAVIAEAQEVAGVDPASIGYVEAHGTGTQLGDPVEIASLSRAFRCGTDGQGYCAIGSIKTNLGHLDAAAGIAGLIKAALAVHHGELPPSLNFDTPNAKIDFASSPFYVNKAWQPWPAGDGPRRAGVSSFGIGGTNAHAVLEEAPPPGAAPPAAAARRGWRLLPLSARTEEAVGRRVEDLGEHLRSHPDLDLDDVAWTLQTGRERFSHRRVVVSRDTGEALQALAEGDLLSRHDDATRRGVAFLFSGLGPQYVGMGRELYEREETFRQEMDRCAEIAARRLDLDLPGVLYPREEDAEEAGRNLEEIAVMLPALFALEYALARLWMSWGVEPAAMIGHSNGEYTAACLAGVFSLEDALSLVGARSRLMQGLPPTGGMLAVPLPPAELEPRLDGTMTVATVNAPELTVVAGPVEEVDALEARLVGEGLECQRLRARHAYHTAMMDPLVEPLVEQVAAVERRPPRIPFVSNVTGTWISDHDACSPHYWGRHLRSPVRFADGVALLLEDPDRVMLEVGPGTGLGNLVRRQAERRIIVPSLRGRKETGSDVGFLVRALGRLWMAGVPVDWQGFHGPARYRRVRLPTYPFARERYWIEGSPGASLPRRDTALRKPLDEWTWVPSWKRLTPLEPPSEMSEERHWLLLIEPHGLGDALAAELARRGQKVTTVEPGDGFERLAEGRYRLDPASRDDFARLLEAVGERPHELVHLWAATAGDRLGLTEARRLGFDGLVHLVQALASLGLEDDATPTGLQVIANGLHEVVTGDAIEPEKALLLGLLKVIPQEIPELRCRCLDIGGSPGGAVARIGHLLAELTAPRPRHTTLVAWRGRHRWQQVFEPLTLPAVGERPALLRQGGVYLVTGGLGNLGRLFARYLVEQAAAKLVFTGRRALPPRDSWEDRLGGNPEEAERLRFLMELEEQDVEYLSLQADVTDRPAMEKVFAAARDRFGAIHGIIHAAGENDPELVQQMQPDGVERVFQPKLAGSLVLAELVAEGEAPDFLLLCSSLASLVGGISLGAYSAANAFLDALALHHDSQGGPRTISVNWGYWQLADEDRERAFQEQYGEAFRERRQSGMRPAEGLEMLGRILAHPLPQIAVSTRDLESELHAVESLRVEKGSGRAAGAARPDLDTPYVAPRDDLEESLVEMWQELIGVEGVGIRDNFYELGGHSLLATRIASRVRDQLGVEMPLERMLAGPTIAEMAEVIVEIQATRLTDTDELAEMLAEIQQLPQEELSSMLEEGNRATTRSAAP